MTRIAVALAGARGATGTIVVPDGATRLSFQA
jgi:hypothetical protein